MNDLKDDFHGLSLFEQKFTIRVLLLIAENPGCCPIELIRAFGSNTAYFRARELAMKGYVRVEKAPQAKWNKMALFPTPKGEMAAKAFNIVFRLRDDEDDV